MLVNRRRRPRRRFADVTFAFQARLELRCEAGFYPRCDLSGYASLSDWDAALRRPALPRRGGIRGRPQHVAPAGSTTRTAWCAQPTPISLPAGRGRAGRAERDHRRHRVRHGALAARAAERPGRLDAALARICPPTTRRGSPQQAAGSRRLPGAPRQATAERLVVRPRRRADRIGRHRAAARRMRQRASPSGR